MGEIGYYSLVKDILDVDVKNLLETGCIIIEKEALESLLLVHQSDLTLSMPKAVLQNVVEIKMKERQRNEEKNLKQQEMCEMEDLDAELMEEPATYS